MARAKANGGITSPEYWSVVAEWLGRRRVVGSNPG
jgi:hypothetical protein